MESEKTPITLSIVVCAFNEEKYIETCLTSLIEQDFDQSCFEIIVMDNESSDATPDIVKRIVANYDGKAQIRYFRIKHVGLSVSRNSAIAQARGSLIAFIDADAYVGKGWIKTIMTTFHTDNSSPIVAGRVLNLNDDRWFSRFIYRAHFSAGVQARSSTKIGGLTGANMVFRRSVLEFTGGFFDGFTSYGDESSVATDYLNNFPDQSVKYVADAVVFNEHPSTLYMWLRQRFFQGRMLFLINTRVDKNNAWKGWLKAGIKLLGLMCFFILLSLPVVDLQSKTILIVTVLFSVVIITRLNYLVNAYAEVSASFNRPVGVLGVITCMAGNIVNDMGFVTEAAAVLLRGKKVSLENSVSEIIDYR